MKSLGFDRATVSPSINAIPTTPWTQKTPENRDNITVEPPTRVNVPINNGVESPHPAPKQALSYSPPPV
jgi:hypothetical protein